LLRSSRTRFPSSICVRHAQAKRSSTSHTVTEEGWTKHSKTECQLLASTLLAAEEMHVGKMTSMGLGRVVVART